MVRYLSTFWGLTFLFGGSFEGSANEFTVYDPGELAALSMDCEATRYANSQLQQHDTSRLHLEVNFAEKRVVISIGTNQDVISMALAGIVPNAQDPAGHLVMVNDTAIAIVSIYHKDIIVVRKYAALQDNDIIS